MSQDQLASIAGVVLSLLFAYIPGLKDWFGNLPKPEYKAAIMAGLIVVVALASFGLACAGWFNVGVTCDVPGIQQLISAVVAALIGNAGAYITLVRPFKSTGKA